MASLRVRFSWAIQARESPVSPNSCRNCISPLWPLSFACSTPCARPFSSRPPPFVPQFVRLWEHTWGVIPLALWAPLVLWAFYLPWPRGARGAHGAHEVAWALWAPWDLWVLLVLLVLWAHGAICYHDLLWVLWAL